MKKKLSQSLNKGYTFIELLVVFSIIGVIGVISIASFVSYNNSQAIDGAASDIASMLTGARQGALSQIKPSQCTSAQTLSGYRVLINRATGTYQTDALCGALIVPGTSKRLPAQISFATSTPPTITFQVPNATISAPVTITINGFSKTKNIRIDKTGTIAIQ
jgi:prepilin-type N-terminal cleavage/methylation domain-containing protein